MSQPQSETSKLPLPLVTAGAEEPAADTWHGWRPAADWADSPEPQAPQGEYGPGGADAPLELPDLPDRARPGEVELLAPAGGMDAGLAAFHFGADAIYLGLKKFSARAEAENFTLDEVDEITAHAHALTPRRRVFVTINTLLRQDELAELVEVVAHLDATGVDALIIQDLGVYRLVREHFPRLELHASTQMSVHNRAGAEALRDLGFARVVLARELTFEEVHDVTAAAGVETEVFIHGALCYAYSGLCLFSSQTLGRSGNRGKCAYSCRDSFEVTGAPAALKDGTPVKRDPRQGFPFSMKDLALPDHLPALRSAGVSCFKIEGRKKSPLYVATTTDYYRRLLDGTLDPADRPRAEADMQTVFSRPWTRLFVQSHKDKEVADRDTVGHRGAPIGWVGGVTNPGTPQARLRFFSSRALQRHDGLQVDLPVLGKPFGFAVERLWRAARQGRREEAFETPAGAWVEVALPPGHPELPPGAPVYCSSSQEVKQKYRHDRPKPGSARVRHGVAVEAELTAAALAVRGRPAGSDSEVVTVTLPGPFAPARDPAGMEEAARAAFAKLGQTRFELASFRFDNPAGLFVPASRLNPLRRELTDALEAAWQRRLAARVESARAAALPAGAAPRRGGPFRWSLKVDRLSSLAHFDERDLAEVDEVIVDIARGHVQALTAGLDLLAEKVGRERVRLALPALTRRWEDKGLRHKIARCRDLGWRRWEAANLSAWGYLGLNPGEPVPAEVDLAADWSVYVLNRLAAAQLVGMGVRRFTLSPEDGLQNMQSLLAEFADRATVIVYQDTPQFLAESCAYANLIGGCPGKANCGFESMEMVSSRGEKCTALDYHCRTIVLNQGPFCLSAHLKELARAGAVRLRADFIYRKYSPEQVRDLWHRLRRGEIVVGAHSANFHRGIL